MVHDVFGARLHAQGIAPAVAGDARAVVQRLLAVQSQDFAPAMWSIAQRLDPAPTLAELGAAFDAGDILRTHVLRPTWHFVRPRDIGWLLALTGPRVLAANRSAWPKLGLTDGVVHQAADLLGQRLEEGPCTRAELVEHLAAAGFHFGGIALSHVLMWAEMTGVMCSGPRRGKEHTYALLAGRAPGVANVERDEALAELVVRYVAGHGPTTLRDLRAWASLPLRDLSVGLAVAGEQVGRAVVDGQEYLVAPGLEPSVPDAVPEVTLLQAFDELSVGYRETRAVIDPRGVAGGGLPRGFEYGNPVVVRGELAGWWRRAERARELDLWVALAPGVRAGGALGRALGAQHARLAAFYGKAPGELSLAAA